MALRRILGVALLLHGVIAGLADSASNAPRQLHGRFLHISGEVPTALISSSQLLIVSRLLCNRYSSR